MIETERKMDKKNEREIEKSIKRMRETERKMDKKKERER
jgi:hypothetical protein